MSNDWEVLQAFDKDKEPIIMNREVQSYGTLRESMRRINLAILENYPESYNLAWVEDREAELEKLQSLFDRIAADNPWSTFVTVFRDAETLTYVRKRDLKDDWGYDFKAIQENWTDLHFAEIPRGGFPSMIAKFWFAYRRTPYGKWRQACVGVSKPGQPVHVDFVGNGYEHDEKWKDTVSRFKGEKLCGCEPKHHLHPDLHLYWPDSAYMASVANAP